jgi:hypothetical protein
MMSPYVAKIFSFFLKSVIIQHDKARSASGRPTTRDAQHPESGVLNSYFYL